MVGKTLLFLGAGHHQVPGILRAVELGYKIVTVDNNSNNIGHKFAHESVNVSTIDLKGVLNAARAYKVDGVLTLASDVATPAVAYVASELGLTGGNYRASQILSNKARFREFQNSEGFNHPTFHTARTFSEFEYVISQAKFPLVAKPVDTSGSRGVALVTEQSNLRETYIDALRFSRTGEICIEDYLIELEVGGDGFLRHGELIVANFTDKRKQGFVVTGHVLPPCIDVAKQTAVIRELERHCNALGYFDGPINFDVMVGESTVTILEMSPRLGGNGIPALIKRHCGIDLFEASIRFAAGDPWEPEKRFPLIPCGSWMVSSQIGGRVTSCRSVEDVRSKVPGVFEGLLTCNPGDRIEMFSHSGHGVGFFLFDCALGDYEQIVETIKTSLLLEVDSD